MTQFITSASRLGTLCNISKQACDALTPMIVTFYSALNDETAKLKADNSVFTIADGIVQHILSECLFGGNKFTAVVGEEDVNVNILQSPYVVDDLIVPVEFEQVINQARHDVTQLATLIPIDTYKDLSVFIDPIDGTREFSTGLGGQCSVCIGFSDSTGYPVAGLVYRPVTNPPTWASGAKSEQYTASNLNFASPPVTNGLLTSNGGISTFIVNLMKELNFVRVPSGGAGNKMLMLLEGHGSAYIQDRGVSRWDTAGAQAVLEAHGGTLCKLNSFMNSKFIESYKYLQTPTNLDFIPSTAYLTPYNAANKGLVKKGEPPKLADDVSQVAPYCNLCGLLALNAIEMESGLQSSDRIFQSLQRAAALSPPSYD